MRFYIYNKVRSDNEKIKTQLNTQINKNSNNGLCCQMCGIKLNNNPEFVLYKKNYGHHIHQFICSDCEKLIKEFIRYGNCAICGKEIKVFNEKLKFEEFDPMTYYYSLFGNVCYDCYKEINK